MFVKILCNPSSVPHKTEGCRQTVLIFSGTTLLNLHAVGTHKGAVTHLSFCFNFFTLCVLPMMPSECIDAEGHTVAGEVTMVQSRQNISCILCQ